MLVEELGTDDYYSASGSDEEDALPAGGSSRGKPQVQGTQWLRLSSTSHMRARCLLTMHDWDLQGQQGPAEEVAGGDEEAQTQIELLAEHLLAQQQRQREAAAAAADAEANAERHLLAAKEARRVATTTTVFFHIIRNLETMHD